MTPLLLAALFACGKDDLPPPPAGDGGTTDGAVDSGTTDGGDGGGTDSGTTDGGTTGDGTDGGTTDPPADEGEGAPSSIRYELTDVNTVIRVSWSTDVPTRGYAVFYEDGSDRQYTTNLTEEGTEHEVLLLGMPAEAVVRFRVVSVRGEEELNSDTYGYETGPLPAELPSLYPTGETRWDGFLALPIEGAINATVILDDQGRYVWYDLLEGDGNLMRAFLTTDRQTMVYCFAGPQSDLSKGKIVRVSIDGSEELEYPAPYIDHDMAELPDGTVAAIVVTAYSGSDPTFNGTQADSIVEFHPDGSTTTVWNAWDALPEAARPGGNWTHANGLDYHPEDDTYTISLKEMSTMVHLDRATGENLWILGGELDQFTYTDGAEPIALHHQFHLLDDSIVIFDNGEQSRGYSRAVEYGMDLDEMTVWLEWEYIRDPPIYVFAKGDVHRYEDGVTQVTWSSAGQIQDVTPDGEVVWELDTDLGNIFTFVQVLDDLYVREGG